MHTCSVSPQSLGLDISTLLILHYCRILKSPSCQDVDATWTLSQRKLRAEYTNLNALPAYTYHLFASRYQIPGLLWTLETHGLSGIPVRHKPAKIQRHSQNPSALSTILPRKTTHLTWRLLSLLSPRILVNKLTVFNTHLCVRQFRYKGNQFPQMKWGNFYSVLYQCFLYFTQI